MRSSLARLGRPFTPMEKRARREAGRNGPQGPAADAAEAELEKMRGEFNRRRLAEVVLLEAKATDHDAELQALARDTALVRAEVAAAQAESERDSGAEAYDRLYTETAGEAHEFGAYYDASLHSKPADAAPDPWPMTGRGTPGR